MRHAKIRTIAYMGLLFALAMALSFLEGLLPVIPGLPPGVKPGLANIVVMHCLLFLGGKKAFGLAFLKSGFVFLTRGASAAVLSLAGGLISVLVMLALLKAFGGRLSYFSLSVAGAVSHNMGQLTAASLMLRSGFAFYYFPVLLVSGVLMGAVTGAVLKVALPALRRIDPGGQGDGRSG